MDSFTDDHRNVVGMNVFKCAICGLLVIVVCCVFQKEFLSFKNAILKLILPKQKKAKDKRAGSRTENAIPEFKAAETSIPASHQSSIPLATTKPWKEEKTQQTIEKSDCVKIKEDVTTSDVLITPPNIPDPVPLPKDSFVPPTDPFSLPKDSFAPPKDSFAPPKDSFVPPTDPFSLPKDSFAPPKDSFAPPKDSFAPPKDSFAPPKDAFAPPRDAFAPPKDTFAPPKDAFAPLKDSFAPPEDSFASPEDSFVPPKDTIINNESIIESNDIKKATKICSEFPEAISDISTQISSEITPSSEKIKKIETEKFHEKTDDRETTFLRTDVEESFKTNASSVSDIPSVPSESERANFDTILKEVSTKNLISESYEVFKTEKTEISTTKNNETLSFSESTGFKSNLPSLNNNIQSQVKNLPSLDADIMSSLNFNSAFSSSDADLDSISITKKKKMFSSSSFYEEPLAKYPTVEEQFDMAKKIAASLADDTNKKSKGANMFFKRAMRAPKWVHEGPEPTDEYFSGTAGTSEEPYSPCNESGKKQSPLKLVLDPRHAEDLASLRLTGVNISEHNTISPDVCHELIRDLESPAGKGSALFAKRKKKSSEWVVDEEKVKSMMRAQEQELNQMKQNINQGVTPKPGLYMSQWDSYIKKTPTADSTGTNKRVNPDQLAETVIKAADVKRRDSIQSLPDEPLYESCRSPIIPATAAASYYDIYRARAPKGWPGSGGGNNMPNADIVCSSPIVQNAGYAEQNSVASYPTAYYNTFPKKYNFQNFNTVPRKWRAQH